MFGTYALSATDRLGVAVDRLEYDFEAPWAVVGVQQDTTVVPKIIDAKVKSTLVSAFYERNYGSRAESWNWHWRAGLGFAKPKAPTVSGPATGGGLFRMRTDAGNETVLVAGAGARYNFSCSVGFELGGTFRHHRAKWKVTDTVSGQTGTIKPYSSVGVEAGFSIRF